MEQVWADFLSSYTFQFLTILSAIYLITVVLAAIFQDRLLFFPSRVIETTPGIFRLEYETVTFPATDGERLSGWHVPHPNAKYTILYCHGNAGNIGDRVDYLKIFHVSNRTQLKFLIYFLINENFFHYNKFHE